MNKLHLIVTASVLVFALGIGSVRAVIENWSTTAANNTDANISPEGMAGTDAPSTIDNSYRELIAQVAEWMKQEEHNIYAATVGGTGDVITITPDIAPDSLTTGSLYTFVAGTDNTGAVTLNVNSLGAVTVQKLNDQALSAGDIEASQVVIVTYDGTNFQMLNPSADTNETGGSGIENVVEDVTPELGGNLDVNDQDIISTSDGSIAITSNGTGAITVTTGGSGAGTIRTGSGNLVLDAGGAGEVQVSGSTTQAGEIEFYEDEDNGTNFIGLRSPTSVSSNETFVLPSVDGTNGQVVQTDGSANLSFVDQTSAAGATTDGFATDIDGESVPGSSTQEVLTYTELDDDNSDYNPATGVYTPSVAGLYYVWVSVEVSSLATSAIRIRKNSADQSQAEIGSAADSAADSTTLVGAFSMNGSTDTLDIEVTNTDTIARIFTGQWGAYRLN